MDPVVAPSHVLRSYAWAVLKANDPDTWDENKYGGLVPIVPLSEEPELDEFSGPRIIYGYANNTTGSLSVRKSGTMTFAIYDQNFRRLGKTLTILEKAFERHDESAADVNAYTSRMPAFVGLAFGWIDVSFVEGGTPEETEGGRQSALINIRYEYYVDYNVTTSV